MDNIGVDIARYDWLYLSDSETEFPEHNNINNLPLVIVETPLCRAVISIQGAQLLGFVNSANHELLWLSPKAIFQNGKAIRGGIPICLPWFGPHPSDSSKPQHGFARVTDWSLAKVNQLSTGEVQLEWRLDNFKREPSPLFPYCFSVKIIMTFGDNLSFDVLIENNDKKEMPVTWALHSYFPVDDLATTVVAGLSGCQYFDNTSAMALNNQQGDVGFGKEVDKQFINVGNTQFINAHLDFEITAENCKSAIVWNPGFEKANTVKDIGGEASLEYVCLERGNILTNEINVKPNLSHKAKMIISVSRKS